MGRVEGKVVVVTGAAQGMGRAIAHTMVKEGAKVVFADMNESGAQEAAQAAADAFSGEAMGMALDVRSREQTAAVIKAAVDAWGRLDVMFNNAGVNRPQKFLETTKENWDFIMDINGWGVMVGMQEAAKQMIAQGRKGELAGKIINTGSIVGKAGLDPNVVPYSVSKYGVAAMTEMGAREFAAHDITVNSYAPGVVDTPLWETLDEQLMELGVSEKKGQAMKDFSAGILRGRAATPADIVGTALYLASSDSDYMTGQTMMIDGGMVFT